MKGILVGTWAGRERRAGCIGVDRLGGERQAGGGRVMLEGSDHVRWWMGGFVVVGWRGMHGRTDAEWGS